MFESKYNKVLTVILVIVIVAIIGLIGYFAYDYFLQSSINNESSDFVDNFKDEIGNDDTDNNGEDLSSLLNGVQDTSITSSSSGKKMYKGFGVLGTIEIPATNLKYPVLEKVTTKSLETAVAFLYGTGLNQEGNTVIIGHNYRNNLFFSNNKRLNIGDKIYITDNDGNRLEYNIYNKFETTPEDTSFYQRDTGGNSEITLSTCTDDSSARLIILAKNEQ